MDLNTGNRKIIAILNDTTLYDLVLDESTGTLYVAGRAGIHMIDIETGRTKIVSSPNDNRGATYSYATRLLLDADNQRLLLSANIYRDDGENIGAIMAVDLAETGYARTLLSAEDERGQGVPFSATVGLALPSGDTTLYALQSGISSVVKVDLASGDRTEMIIDCKPDLLDAFRSPKGMFLSPDEKILMIIGHGTIVIDLESGECVDHIRRWYYSQAQAPAKGGTLFSAEAGGIYLLDPKTLERVIVSQ